jgi:hypothetical protein
MEHTFKKLKYDGDREALESEFDLFLEAWIDDLEKAAKLLAGNL